MIEYYVSLGLAVLTAPYIHEGSHWFTLWIGGGDPVFNRKILPNGVFPRNIESVDSEVIRFSGIAPYFWMPIGIVALILFLSSRSTPLFFIAAAIFGATIFMGTESDAVAFREPEVFRQQVLEEEVSRDPLFFPNWILPDWLPRF